MPRGDTGSARAAAAAPRAARASSAPAAQLAPLSGLDALFLQFESPEMPMHVGSLSLLDLPPGFRGDFSVAVRRLIGRRLHLADAFRRVLTPMPFGLGNPVWQFTDDIDLDHHVQRVTLPAPGTRAQLMDCVAQLHAQVLDRRRPLWQLVVIDGLGGELKGRVGYYAKVHHAAIDGQAGVALAQAMLDVTPVPRDVPPPPARQRAAAPTTAQRLALLAQQTARQWQQLASMLPAAAQSLRAPATAAGSPPSTAATTDPRGGSAPLLSPRTPLSVAISAERAFEALSLPLADVKATARALGASVNDVVLATVSGALRRWLARHGGVPRRPIAAAVPFSVRARGDGRAGNQVSMMRAALATHLADPRARLDAIRRSMGVGKAVTGRFRALVPTDYPSLGGAWIAGGLGRLAGALGHRLKPGTALPSLAPVAISNVPGPPQTLYLAGATIRHYWPASIVIHGVALNVTVQSYAEWLDIGITACRRAMPDVAAFADDLRFAFAELQALVPASVAASETPDRPSADRAPRSPETRSAARMSTRSAVSRVASTRPVEATAHTPARRATSERRAATAKSRTQRRARQAKAPAPRKPRA